MTKLFALAATLCAVASAGLAAEFDRPVPQPQSATAEFWYALACLMLIASMVAVHWLVSRK